MPASKRRNWSRRFGRDVSYRQTGSAGRVLETTRLTRMYGCMDRLRFATVALHGGSR